MTEEEALKLKIGDRCRVVEEIYTPCHIIPIGTILEVCEFRKVEDYDQAVFKYIYGCIKRTVTLDDYLSIERIELGNMPLTLEQALDLRIGDRVKIIKSGEIGKVDGFFFSGNNSKDACAKDVIVADPFIKVLSVGDKQWFYKPSQLTLPPKELTLEERIEELKKEFEAKLEELRGAK